MCIKPWFVIEVGIKRVKKCVEVFYQQHLSVVQCASQLVKNKNWSLHTPFFFAIIGTNQYWVVIKKADKLLTHNSYPHFAKKSKNWFLIYLPMLLNKLKQKKKPFSQTIEFLKYSDFMILWFWFFSKNWNQPFFDFEILQKLEPIFFL